MYHPSDMYELRLGICFPSAVPLVTIFELSNELSNENTVPRPEDPGIGEVRFSCSSPVAALVCLVSMPTLHEYSRSTHPWSRKICGEVSILYIFFLSECEMV